MGQGSCGRRGSCAVIDTVILRESFSVGLEIGWEIL